MDSKMIKKVLCASLIILSLCPAAFAKKKKKVQIIDLPLPTTENAQDATSEANEIRQPFSWDSAGDVLKYEITIEQFSIIHNNWIKYFEHETNDEETQNCIIYIEPTLPPGKYRSTIKVYNILGILESSLTSQDEFLVRQAFQPEVRKVTYPLYMRSIIYLDDLDNNGVVEVEGRNLFNLPETRQPVPDIQATEYYLEGSKGKIELESIIHHDDSNRKLTLQFDMKKLDVGKYHLVAKDASGLHSENNASSEFAVKFRKWMDFDIEAGYTCGFVLHDDTIENYLGNTMFPLSGQFKISLIPFKFNRVYFGFGIRGNYSYFKSEHEGYDIDGNIMSGHAIFILQIPRPIPIGKPRSWFLEVHGGAGVTYFHNVKFHFPHDIVSKQLNTLSLSYDAGASLMFYLTKRLFVEAGCDYVFTQNKDMPMGEALPYAGIGWQF